MGFEDVTADGSILCFPLRKDSAFYQCYRTRIGVATTKDWLRQKGKVGNPFRIFIKQQPIVFNTKLNAKQVIRKGVAKGVNLNFLEEAGKPLSMPHRANKVIGSRHGLRSYC